MSSFEQGFLLLVDGLDWAFWTREDMAAGAGAVSGISRANNFVGLQIPSTSTAIDVKTGELQQSATTFRLVDIPAELAALLAPTQADPLPPAVFYTLPGETAYDAAIHGKQVGIEAIGAAGERGQYPAIQTYQLGSFHVGNQFLSDTNSGEIYASDEPFIFAGRRVALYRFTRTGDAWGDYAGAQRVWWGTLRDGGTVSARKWSITADGPDSWLKKTLNQASWQTPLPFQPGLPLALNETRYGFRGSLKRYVSVDGNIVTLQPRWCNWQEPDSATEDAALLSYTPAELRTWFRTTLCPLIFNNAGSGAPAAIQVNAWTSSNANGSFFAGPDGSLSITLASNLGGWQSSLPGDTVTDDASGGVGVFEIVLHGKVWKALGWSPEEQDGIGLDDAAGVEFVPVGPGSGIVYQPSDATTAVQPFTDYPPGYWMGRFYSCVRPNLPADLLNGLVEGTLFSGDGISAQRLHEPLYGGGVGVGILAADIAGIGGQNINSVGTGELVYVQRQFDAPVGADLEAGDAVPVEVTYPGPPVSTSPADSQRLFAIIGQYRKLGTDEAEDRVQVVRCSWQRGDSNSTRLQIERENGIASPMKMTRWHVPQAFNFEDAQIASDWLGLVDQTKGALRIVPIANLGTQAAGPTRADRAILALLVSSGTSGGWYLDAGFSTQGYGGAAWIEPGLNNKSSALSLNPFITDRKAADFGLGIPAEMVAPVAEWEQLAFDLPAEMANVTVAEIGPVSGDDVLRGIMQPLGWSWSLRGGQYGAFKPSDADAAGAEDAVLDGESMAGSLGAGSGIPSQNIRYRTALDAIQLKLRRDPWRKTYKQETRIRSTDAGAFYRSGASVLTLEAPYLTGDAFDSDVRAHWSPIFKWLAKRHFLVRGLKVLQSVGANLWPGSRVRITHPWLVSQLGTYGVTNARGIVLAVQQDWPRAQTTIDLLVTQPPGQGERIAAPEANAWAFDSGTNKIYCAADFRQTGNDHHDVAAFERPSWASGTGGLDVLILQYARGQLVQTLTGTVQDVDAVADTITLDAAPVGGTWLRDCETFIVPKPFATQTATWPATTFNPIAAEDGTVNGVAANAVKWSDT